MKNLFSICFIIFTAFLCGETLFVVKDSANNPVLKVSEDGIAVMNQAYTIMVISTTEIKAVIDDSKALSRKFSVSTTSAKKGLYTDLFDVSLGSSTMRGGLDGGRYADFSPENIFLGLNSGNSNTTGYSNVFIGNEAGYSTQDKAHQTYIGSHAGKYASGYSNTYVGSYAGYDGEGYTNSIFGMNAGWYCSGNANSVFGYHAGRNLGGSLNVIMGQEAGYGVLNATFGANCLIGYKSGYSLNTGSKNVALGSYSGYTNSTGTENVFLGYMSGYYETGSNKLYIENTNSSSPLIYGEFDNDLVRINGDFNVTGSTSLDSTLQLGGDSWFTDHALYLRGYNDINHGLKFVSTWNSTNINGPALFGYDGGMLGTSINTALALRWDNSGSIFIPTGSLTVSTGNVTVTSGDMKIPGLYTETIGVGTKKAVYVDSLGKLCVLAKGDEDNEKYEKLQNENDVLRTELSDLRKEIEEIKKNLNKE